MGMPEEENIREKKNGQTSSQSLNFLSDFQVNVVSVHLFQHKVTLRAINGMVEDAFISKCCTLDVTGNASHVMTLWR